MKKKELLAESQMSEDQVITRQKARLLIQKVQKARFDTRLNKLFWALVALGTLALCVFVAYSYSGMVLEIIQAKTGVDLLHPWSKSPETLLCSELNLTENESGHLVINAPLPKVGQCYMIPEQYQTLWSKEFGTKEEIVRLAQVVAKKSTGTEMSLDTICVRILESTTSWVLNLTLDTK